jgi:hypothetical protein
MAIGLRERSQISPARVAANRIKAPRVRGKLGGRWQAFDPADRFPGHLECSAHRVSPGTGDVNISRSRSKGPIKKLLARGGLQRLAWGETLTVTEDFRSLLAARRRHLCS